MAWLSGELCEGRGYYHRALYTDGGHVPANATTQEPEKCTCRDSWARADDGAGVRRLAAEFNGWRSRRQQWL